MKKRPSSPSEGTTGPSRNFPRLLFVFAACALLINILLFSLYRVEDRDDPWVLSILYNYHFHGATLDLTFGHPGISFLRSFGKIYYWIAVRFLDFFGWTKNCAYSMATGCVLLSIGIWARILRRLGFSWPLVLSFGIIASILDPFFSAAHSARLDAYTFLFNTLSFWLFIEKRYFLSMLAFFIAFESGPIGIAVLPYILAYLYAISPSIKEWVRDLFNLQKYRMVLAGLATGAALYFLLHHQFQGVSLSGMAQENQLNGYNMNNFFEVYFFESKYFRHLPELAILLASLFVFWREKLHQKDKLIGPMLAFLIGLSLVVTRPNFHYVVFTYPAILLFVLRVWELKKALPWVVSLYMALMIPQYFFVYRLNHSFDLQRHIQGIQSAVPKDDLPIVGSPNDWFAFRDRKFYYNDYMGDYQNLGLKDFYLVEDDYYRSSSDQMRDWIDKNFKGTGLTTLELNGRSFTIERMRPLGGR